VLIVNPSKSGGDWWHGRLVGSGESGSFPKTFVQVVEPGEQSILFVYCGNVLTLISKVTAKALYDYSGGSPDELQFEQGDIISIIDKNDEEWWKAERDGVVYILPATYVEIEG